LSIEVDCLQPNGLFTSIGLGSGAGVESSSLPCSSLSFDTETIQGCAKLLTLGNGSYHFIDSFETAMAILESTADTYFGWNADYDIIALLKYLPEENLKELHLKHRTTYGPYEIRYIPEKFMHVKNSSTHRTISFYDLSQFYGHVSLDKASELYLGEHKAKEWP